MPTSAAKPKPPAAAMALGAAGLLPFAAGALGAIIGEGAALSFAREALIGYGAIILGYMGGCRFGLHAAGLGQAPLPVGRAAREAAEAAAARAEWASYSTAVTPALWAFFVFLAQGVIGFGPAALCLAAGFAALYVTDVSAAARGAAPAWWPALRAPLTLGAVLALAGPALVTLLT